MVETLRKCGWEVGDRPISNDCTSYRISKDGLDAPANQLSLPSRAHNILSGLYGSGRLGFSPTGEENLSGKSYKDGELTVRDLLEDITSHEGVFLDTRNLGRVTLTDIKKAIAAADKYNSYSAQLSDG